MHTQFQNSYIASLEQNGIYGHNFQSLADGNQIPEIWFKDECFEFDQFGDKQIEAESWQIMGQGSQVKGELTNILSFNIETYCQEGSGNGLKGVCRVVLANEFGQRVFDSQIKMIKPAQTSNRKQAQFLRM